MVKAPKGYYTILDFMTMNDFERNVALSEYKNLIQSGLDVALEPGVAVSEAKKKVRRKKSAYSKALSRELKAANIAARTKSGKLRKGMTPGKILKKAHRAAKRRLK